MSEAHNTTVQEHSSHRPVWNTYHIIIIPVQKTIPVWGTSLIRVWLIPWISMARSGLDSGEDPGLTRGIRIGMSWLYQALFLWIFTVFGSSEETKQKQTKKRVFKRPLKVPYLFRCPSTLFWMLSPVLKHAMDFSSIHLAKSLVISGRVQTWHLLSQMGISC